MFRHHAAGEKLWRERLEAACRRALTIGACSYKSIESILKNGLDRTPLPTTSRPRSPSNSQYPRTRVLLYYHKENPDADTSHARQTAEP